MSYILQHKCQAFVVCVSRPMGSCILKSNCTENLLSQFHQEDQYSSNASSIKAKHLIVNSTSIGGHQNLCEKQGEQLCDGISGPHIFDYYKNKSYTNCSLEKQEFVITSNFKNKRRIILSSKCNKSIEIDA